VSSKRHPPGPTIWPVNFEPSSLPVNVMTLPEAGERVVAVIVPSLEVVPSRDLPRGLKGIDTVPDEIVMIRSAFGIVPQWELNPSTSVSVTE